MIAIDLGSNTLRVVQLDCQSGLFGSSFEKIVKTADGLAQTGVIDSKSIQRVIVAIKEAGLKIDLSSEPLFGVTTEALRRASNSDEVLAEIERETGIKFDIISGEKEASLTLLAVENRLKMTHEKEALWKQEHSFLLIDIGGGSTELIFRYPHRVISRSFPVGIVTTVQCYHTLEAIEEGIPRLMSEMEIFMQEVYAKEGKVDAFVATAGTPTTVAALTLGQTYATYDAQQINGVILEIPDLERELHHLLSSPFEEREEMVGVGRSDLISAGILIFKQLFLISQMKGCSVIDDGLREGVALQKCHELVG